MTFKRRELEEQYLARETLMIKRFPSLGKPSRFHPSGSTGKMFFASSIRGMSHTGVVLYGLPGDLGIRHGKWDFKIYIDGKPSKSVDLNELINGGRLMRDLNITFERGYLIGPEMDRIVLMTDFHFDPVVFETNLYQLRSFMANINENPVEVKSDGSERHRVPLQIIIGTTNPPHFGTDAGVPVGG